MEKEMPPRQVAKHVFAASEKKNFMSY